MRGLAGNETSLLDGTSGERRQPGNRLNLWLKRDGVGPAQNV